MVTICKQVLVLPHESVAVQVLLIVYSCGHVPAIVTSLYVTAGAGSQVSVALAIPVLSAEVESVHSIVTSAGQEITGTVKSCTTMVALQVEELPQSSVAVHVLVTLYVPPQDPSVMVSVEVRIKGSQNSVTMGGINTGDSGHSIGVV